jgi:hypothetical protein
MEHARIDAEIFDTLEDVQATLEVIVERLGLEQEVKAAIGARRLKAERSRLEIARSLGQGVEEDGG